MKLRHAGKTHVGMKRPHNEDSICSVPEHHLFLVADGMGGHASGEVASKMAVDTVADFFYATAEDSDITWPYRMDKSRRYDENRLITAVKLANLRIFEAATEDMSKKGMGTTLVTLLFSKVGAHVCHVGDSRVYILRNGTIRQITEDHSLLNDYMKTNQLTEEEVANFKYRNVIVRALGMRDVVQVDSTIEKPMVGDIFLLCSDGLSGMIDDERMMQIIHKNRRNLDKACDVLIDVANKNGGTDNISVVLVEVVEV